MSEITTTKLKAGTKLFNERSKKWYLVVGLEVEWIKPAPSSRPTIYVTVIEDGADVTMRVKEANLHNVFLKGILVVKNFED